MPRRKNKKLKKKRANQRFESLFMSLANRQQQQQETEEERERREREQERRDVLIDSALKARGLVRHRVAKDGACMVGDEEREERVREGREGGFSKCVTLDESEILLEIYIFSLSPVSSAPLQSASITVRYFPHLSSHLTYPHPCTHS